MGAGIEGSVEFGPISVPSIHILFDPHHPHFSFCMHIPHVANSLQFLVEGSSFAWSAPGPLPPFCPFALAPLTPLPVPFGSSLPLPFNIFLAASKSAAEGGASASHSPGFPGGVFGFLGVDASQEH